MERGKPIIGAKGGEKNGVANFEGKELGWSGKKNQVFGTPSAVWRKNPTTGWTDGRTSTGPRPIEGGKS